ncbi:MAG: tetratricopeptide repeat protein [Candidatus Thorarchaeota archaeon]
MDREHIEIRLEGEDLEYYETTMSAIQLWKDDKKKEAIEKLQGLVEKFPDVPGVYHHLSGYLHETGSRDKAYGLVEKAISLDENNPDSYIQKAKLATMDGNFEDASELVDLALSKTVNIYLTFLVAAQVFSDYGMDEKAVEIYEEGVKRIPQSGAIWRDYAKLYSEKFAFEKAIDVMKRGVNAAGNDKELLLDFAILTGGLGITELAIPVIKAYEKLSPDDKDHYVNLARMYMASMELNSAEDAIKKALKRDKMNDKAWMAKASLAKFRGKQKDADKAYDEMIKINRRNEGLVNTIRSTPAIRSTEVISQYIAIQNLRTTLESIQRGDQQSTVENLKKAIKSGTELWLEETLVSAAKSDDTKLGLLKLLTSVIETSGDKKKNIGILHRATKQFPDDSTLWMNLAVSSYNIRSYHGALKAIEKAKSIDPSIKGANGLHGRISINLDDYDQGYVLTKLAYEENPKDISNLTFLVASCIELKKFDEAEQYNNEGLDLNPKVPYFYGYKAHIEHHHGRLEEAKQSLEACSKIDPNIAKEFEEEINEISK